MGPVAAMLCMFLVVVQTSEDMVLIRRVNQPANQLLDLLRRKLISNNVDYEEQNHGAALSPSLCIDIVNATLPKFRNSFNPHHAPERDFAQSTLYNPYHHPHHKPLHNPGYAPFHRAPYLVLASLDPSVYKFTELPVTHRTHRETLQPSDRPPQEAIEHVAKPLHKPKQPSKRLPNQLSQYRSQHSSKQQPSHLHSILVQKPKQPTPLPFDNKFAHNPNQLSKYLKQISSKLLSQQESLYAIESGLNSGSGTKNSLQQISQNEPLQTSENLFQQSLQNITQTSKQTLRPFRRPPRPTPYYLRGWVSRSLSLHQDQVSDQFLNHHNPSNKQPVQENLFQFRAYRFEPTSRSTSSATTKTFPTNSLKTIKYLDPKSMKKPIIIPALDNKNKLNSDVTIRTNSSSQEVWKNEETTPVPMFKGFKLAPGVNPLQISSREQRTTKALDQEDLERLLMQAMQRAERRGSAAQLDFQKYQNVSMRRSNGFLRLKYAHGIE